MGSDFLCEKIVSLFQVFSVYLFQILCLISDYILRVQGFGSIPSKKSEDGGKFIQKDNIEFMRFYDDDDKDNEEEEEEEEEEELKFKFPTYEEFSKKGNLFNTQVVPSASTSKYEFLSGKSFVTTFIDDVETFHIKENSNNFEQVCIGSRKGKEVLIFGGDENEVMETHVEKSGENSGLVRVEEESLDESEFRCDKSSLVSESNSESPSFEQIDSVINDLVDTKSDGLISESESESSSFEQIRSVMNNLVGSHSDDGFLSDGDFGGSESESERIELERQFSRLQENDELSENFDDEETDILEELKNLEEEEYLESSNVQNPVFLSENDFDNDDLEKDYSEGFVWNGEKKMNGVDKSKKSEEPSDDGDEDELGMSREYDVLIEQLKMEIANEKEKDNNKDTGLGLPTILEESESPKITDDLKPWKVDEELQHEDCFGELRKFYKAYGNRMRKFDILNFQKLTAMGFVQLKDPVQSTPKQALGAPTLRSIVSQNMWLSKHKIHGSDPKKKSIQGLEGDLEVVYVGQMCLAWELLHWQHAKSLELWRSDPHGIRRYNEAADEFRLFQVLVQRFLEDETFQGPRVESYVKRPFTQRNLLKVPAIRVDKKKQARNIEIDGYVTTANMLVGMVEESIRLFWRFVRADKDCCAVNGKKPEIKDPEELKLWMELKKSLEKTDRKLKDVLRSENCILRKFRRCKEEDESDQVLKFFSQVDLKLVARVLNMPKVTRDQLIWCKSKLGRIRIVNRKIYIDPAFLLFPSS